MQELVLSEEQELLKKTAADFTKQHSPVKRIRALRDANDPIGFSTDLWRRMADLGWPGIPLPEEYGGLGLGYAELIVVLEELGRSLAPEPFLSSVLLGANGILLAGSPEQKQAILPRVASGEMLLALACHEPGTRHDLFRVRARGEAGSRGQYVLDGAKDFVLDGQVAHRIVVVARTSGSGSDRAGLSLFLVDRDARGVEVVSQRLVDGRLTATVRLQRVSVAASDVVGKVNEAGDVIERVVDRALVGLSAEMLGAMSEAFERTLAYLKERRQFGVVIGTFQALKHRAANMFVELELSRSAVMAAARAIDSNAADAPALASAAKAKCSQAFVLIANEGVQMHGGIGMTDEHEIGFFLKRARAAELSFGDAVFHRDRFARLQGY